MGPQSEKLRSAHTPSAARDSRQAARAVRARGPRQERAENTRRRILEAAVVAFAEHGFEGAMTRDIARAAHVHQPVIHYHFDSKEGLWKAAVAHIFEKLGRSFAAALRDAETDDPAEAFRTLLRRYVLFNARYPELNRLMLQTAMAEGPRLEWIVEHHLRPFFETTYGRIVGVQSTGWLADIPPLALYHLLIGAASSIFTMAPACRLLSSVDPMRGPVSEAYADAVVALFFRDGPGKSRIRTRRVPAGRGKTRARRAGRRQRTPLRRRPS